MPRACSVCTNPGRDEIEKKIVARSDPKRRIASQHGVSERAVRYHERHHLPTALALAQQTVEVAHADDLLRRFRHGVEKLHELEEHVDAVLDRAVADQDKDTVLRELQARLEQAASEQRERQVEAQQ